MIYEGLGFPVKLYDVETRTIRGEEVPILNHRRLEDAVFHALIWMPARFSGAHLNFIRGYMGLTQVELAKSLGLSGHGRVSQWEKQHDKPTGMSLGTDVLIRLIMAQYLHEKEFFNQFEEYLSTTLLSEKKPTPLELKKVA